MDLRGYGKYPKRTWYSRRPLKKADYISMIVSALIFAASLFVRFFINHSMFYNPFI
jgi:energy-coupling factor transport system permease protein